ncbi:MAG: hypothetical protein WBR26_16445 [Candidatus Acidiferrum sp.]
MKLRHRKMSVRRHQELGKKLQEMHRFFRDLYSEMDSVHQYRENSPTMRKVARMRQMCTELQYRFRIEMIDEHFPDGENWQFATVLYFGPDRYISPTPVSQEEVMLRLESVLEQTERKDR